MSRRNPRRRTGLAILLAVTSGYAFVPGSAGGAPEQVAEQVAGPQQHTVVMGAVDPGLADSRPRPPAGPGRLDRFEYLAYYPDHLEVHRGDTVRFRRDGFHTVTFSAEGDERRGFFRRDEVEGVAAEDSQAPSHPGCGTPEIPCELTGVDGFLNSGWQDLTVTIDAPVGTYTYYCMLHEGMQGTVEVVPDDEPVPDPEQVAADRARAVLADTAHGAALLAANQEPEFEVVGGRVRWVVRAGDITADERVAVLRFMPSNLEIAPGDEVEFVVPGDNAAATGRNEVATELHTATFPSDPVLQQFGMLRYLIPSCDPDDPASGAPGVPGQYHALILGCAPGTTLELLFQPGAWKAPTRAPGDLVTSAATVHDSGLLTRSDPSCRSTCDPWTGEPFPDRSRAMFPVEGTFGYVCLVHPEWGMAASVTVAGG